MTKTTSTDITPLEFITKTLKEISHCDASIKNINAEMEAVVSEYKAKNGPALTKLTERLAAAYHALEEFADANRELLFKEKKSFDATMGTFGFRTSKPKLVLLPHYNWVAVTNMVKALFPNYIRTSYEVSKAKLLEDRNIPEIAKSLKDVGLDVIQEETFFCDLHK